MLCGQTPDQSGITENRWPDGVVGLDPAQATGCAEFLAQRPLGDRGISPTPTPPQTLFEQVPLVGRRKHLSVVSWGWIAKLSAHIPHLCDTVDTKGDDDAALKEFTSLYTRDDEGLLPRVAFLHLDEVDGTGHKHGWESDAYLNSWGEADARIAAVLCHIASQTSKEKDSNTLVIICSDHGGSGHNHGANDVRHMEVPILAVNIGGMVAAIPPTSSGNSRSLLDIAPTVLSFLGVNPVSTHRGAVIPLLLA